MSDEDTQKTERETRRKILKKATATIDGEVHTILIRDLSSHGALLKIDRAVGLGETLNIHIDGYPDLQAEVRWTKGDRIGVRFDEGITLDEKGLPDLKDKGGAPNKSFVPWNPYTAPTPQKRPAARPKVFGRADPKRPGRS